MFFFKSKNIPVKDFFPNDFVDIHSHLLPSIDDGAKSLAHSIELIKRMRSFGIKNFITTPHILGDIYPNTPEIILEKLTIVRNELQNQGINDIKINASAEYMMDEFFLKYLEADKILPLKDNFILVEMSYMNAPYNLFDILFQIQVKGYKPILAHPERYKFYHDDINNYYKLKKAGCLFQLNLLSLTQQYGKSVQTMANKLIQENLYDYVGTDTHHNNHLSLLETISTKKNKTKIERLLMNNLNFK